MRYLRFVICALATFRDYEKKEMDYHNSKNELGHYLLVLAKRKGGD